LAVFFGLATPPFDNDVVFTPLLLGLAAFTAVFLAAFAGDFLVVLAISCFQHRNADLIPKYK
jgi:hypothetical protein